MKTIEEIENTISNYYSLIELVKSKVLIMEQIDRFYSKEQGIESIEFYDDSMVTVTCDDSCRGCYSNTNFSFPIYFLTLDGEQLKTEIELSKEKRLKENDEQKKLQETKEQQAINERELREYERLKNKFKS